MSANPNAANRIDAARTLPAEAAPPAPITNPFLEPAWVKPLVADVPVPAPVGPEARLTKKQTLVYQEGQTQLLQQHFQRSKAAYAVVASAYIEDLANAGYVHVGTNIVRRLRRAPAELQPYLALMMDAQLSRAGQELNQIASDHARTQNEIVSHVVEVADEALVPFWARLLRPVTKG